MKDKIDPQPKYDPYQMWLQSHLCKGHISVGFASVFAHYTTPHPAKLGILSKLP